MGIVFHAAESFYPDRNSWAVIDRNAHMAFDLFQYVCHGFRMEIFLLIAGLFAHRGIVASHGMCPRCLAVLFQAGTRFVTRS